MHLPPCCVPSGTHPYMQAHRLPHAHSPSGQSLPPTPHSAPPPPLSLLPPSLPPCLPPPHTLQEEQNKFILEEPYEGMPLVVAALFQPADAIQGEWEDDGSGEGVLGPEEEWPEGEEVTEGTLVTLRVQYLLPSEWGLWACVQSLLPTQGRCVCVGGGRSPPLPAAE